MHVQKISILGESLFWSQNGQISNALQEMCTFTAIVMRFQIQCPLHIHLSARIARLVIITKLVQHWYILGSIFMELIQFEREVVAIWFFGAGHLKSLISLIFQSWIEFSSCQTVQLLAIAPVRNGRARTRKMALSKWLWLVMYGPGQVERLRAHVHSLKAEQHNRDLAELRLVRCNHGTGIEWFFPWFDGGSQEVPAIHSQLQGVRSVEVELRDGQDGVESRKVCFDQYWTCRSPASNVSLTDFHVVAFCWFRSWMKRE